jgi:oligopeptide transport system permease protein
VVTEEIFNIKGVGGVLFTAIRTREGAVVTGVITVLVLLYLLVSLLVDLLYAVLDPRIRYE